MDHPLWALGLCGGVSKVSQVTVCIELEKPAAAGLLGKGSLETKFKYQPFCILAA